MTIEQFVRKYILLEKIYGEGEEMKSEHDKGYLAQHPLFDQVI